MRQLFTSSVRDHFLLASAMRLLSPGALNQSTVGLMGKTSNFHVLSVLFAQRQGWNEAFLRVSLEKNIFLWPYAICIIRPNVNSLI